MKEHSTEDIRKELEAREWVLFKGLGESMRPLYPPGTLLRLRRFTNQRVQLGALILIEDGQHLLLHRVVKIDRSSDCGIWTKGDARRVLDAPCSRKQILAVTDGVIKGHPAVPACLYRLPIINLIAAHASLIQARFFAKRTRSKRQKKKKIVLSARA